MKNFVTEKDAREEGRELSAKAKCYFKQMYNKSYFPETITACNIPKLNTQSTLEHFGAFWSTLELYRALWSTLEHSETRSAALNLDIFAHKVALF